VVVIFPLKLTIEIVRFHRKGVVRNPVDTMEGSVPEHKFKVGESVSFTSGPFGRGGTNGIYKVTRLLPPERWPPVPD
jgi:transcription antitermination factor NusG